MHERPRRTNPGGSRSFNTEQRVLIFSRADTVWRLYGDWTEVLKTRPGPAPRMRVTCLLRRRSASVQGNGSR